VFEFEQRCDWATRSPTASNFGRVFAKSPRKLCAPRPSIGLGPQTYRRTINTVQCMNIPQLATPAQAGQAVGRISNPENYLHRQLRDRPTPQQHATARTRDTVF
jgi:hypothetical protein